jgi:exopolysaccharide biosynthesis WecB/TagA/CpsF family protein
MNKNMEVLLLDMVFEEKVGMLMPRIKFMNTMIDNLTMDETLEEIDRLITANKKSYLVTPNVDHIVKLEHDKELQKIYQEADLIITDGQPLIWISKYYKNPIKEKVSGSDLFPRLCEMAAEKGYSVFLLGAAEGVADMAAENLRKRFEKLNIVGTYSPPKGFDKDEAETNKILSMIAALKPHILIVGLGCPKQEKFIYEYHKIMDVPLSLGLGASIDFVAGKVKRAPAWMRRFGLEWFYRFMKEPRRMFKRYFIDDMKIFKLIFKYK